jgi:hypothetical protein
LIAGSALRQLLDFAQLSAAVDPIEFAKCLLVTAERLAHLAGVLERLLSDDPSSPKLQAYVRQSLAILGEAMALNEDETSVLRWFRDQPLPEFGMKTPAVLVSEGDAESLPSYIRSIESGASG